jgi:hypothetical protein
VNHHHSSASSGPGSLREGEPARQAGVCEICKQGDGIKRPNGAIICRDCQNGFKAGLKCTLTITGTREKAPRH